MLQGVSQIAHRSNDGRAHTSFLYKPAVAAAAGAGGWVDASMSSGIPIYNAYVGSQFEATPLIGSGNKGIYTGIPKGRRLFQWMMQTRSAVTPCYLMLCDYLLFYPLFELDSTDTQETIATASLPRFASGEGVQIVPVCTLPSSASTLCTMVYTNSQGIPGRTVTSNLRTGSSTGSIIASSDSTVTTAFASPFLPLANGDIGVRSIESVTFSTGVGGFVCFVLVKPIAMLSLPEQNTASEIGFPGNRFSMPLIPEGAYLNFLIKTQTAAASAWLGQLNFLED